MKTRNELFLDVVTFLVDKGHAKSQADVAKKAKLGACTISRIKNGRVKEVGDDVLRKLCKAFDFINIAYLRGASDQMTNNGNKDKEPEEGKECNHIDNSSLMNATISAGHETIESLKRQNDHYSDMIATLNANFESMIKMKDETIKTLKANLEDKDHIISLLKSQIALLQKQVNHETINEYPFQVGVAEPIKIPKI